MKAVVKFLKPDLTYQRPEFIKIFVEEARLTEEIGQTCWNVVRVFNVRERPWPYFFMEYLRGKNLDEVINEAGGESIPLCECKGYLRGIAKALAATHVHKESLGQFDPTRRISRPDPERAWENPKEREVFAVDGEVRKLLDASVRFDEPCASQPEAVGPTGLKLILAHQCVQVGAPDRTEHGENVVRVDERVVVARRRLRSVR